VVVFDLLCLALLLEKDHEGVVDQVEAAAIERPERIERVDDVVLDDRPSNFVK
jgi:hypothetical protein